MDSETKNWPEMWVNGILDHVCYPLNNSLFHFTHAAFN